MKKIMLWILEAVMVLSLAACGKSSSSSQMPNPFTDHSSMEEAEQAAGFSLTVPDKIDGFSDRIIRTMKNEDGTSMIEVIYRNEQDQSGAKEDEIRIRKENGTEDISGDYTDYAESSIITVNEIPVSVKGDNGSIRLATWHSGDYSYSVGFYSENGISSEDLEDYVSSIQ